MEDLLNTPKYATLHGAAYGLAGVLKGIGIAGSKYPNLHQTSITAKCPRRKVYSTTLEANSKYGIVVYLNSYGTIYRPLTSSPCFERSKRQAIRRTIGWPQWYCSPDQKLKCHPGMRSSRTRLGIPPSYFTYMYRS